jgi:thiamine kinase-like enzyme
MIDPITRIMVLPLWTGPVHPRLLPGGLGNHSYLVEDAGKRYVVRFGRDHPSAHVFRAWELMVSQAAHRAGFAAPIIHTGPGVFVGTFIDGKNCTPEDIRDNMEPIVRMLRRFHDEMPPHVSGAAHMFWPPHVVRDYARTLKAERHRHAAKFDEWLAMADEMEDAQVAMPIVFGHNDLVSRNIVDDGERFWFIDYEHAGFTTALADLAGLASHSEFDDDQTSDMLATYFGEAPAPEIRRSYDAMACLMPLREALWGMMAESRIDIPHIDYVAYGDDKLELHRRAVRLYRGKYG